MRLTFTTKLETESNTATLETANEAAEQAKFLRYSNAKRVNSRLFDKTNGSADGFSQRLSGGVNERYGLARSLSVMPGDTVKMEVYAKYVDSDTVNWTSALNVLMGQITDNAGGVVVDGVNYTTSTTTFPYPGLQNTSGSSGTGPKAFLNWLVFDRDYNFITGGYQRMSTSAKENGQDVAHEKLSGQLVATQPGYVYIYLSNEETTPVDVFFDDFKVTQVKSPVVQSDDYYPFGLAFNSYSRENSEKNNYLYNGKELQDELDLGWLDYGARMYMPEIGRWGVSDRAAEKFYAWTPYNFCFNNPVRFNDPDGNAPGDVVVRRTRRFNKTDEDGNYNVKSIHDLGHTGVGGFQRNSKGQTEVVLDIAFNYRFVDGPYQNNNANSQLNKDNPGLFDEVQAHEEAHADQYEEVLKTSNDFSYGGHEGNIVEVFDKAYADITDSFKKQMEGAKTEKEAKAIQNKYQSALTNLVGSLAGQATQKVTAKYGGRQRTEDDANARASAKLKSKGKREQYINNRRKIKYEGKEIN